jgi:hypothetical protein
VVLIVNQGDFAGANEIEGREQAAKPTADD